MRERTGALLRRLESAVHCASGSCLPLRTSRIPRLATCCLGPERETLMAQALESAGSGVRWRSGDNRDLPSRLTTRATAPSTSPVQHPDLPGQRSSGLDQVEPSCRIVGAGRCARDTQPRAAPLPEVLACRRCPKAGRRHRMCPTQSLWVFDATMAVRRSSRPRRRRGGLSLPTAGGSRSASKRGHRVRHFTSRVSTLGKTRKCCGTPTPTRWSKTGRRMARTQYEGTACGVIPSIRVRNRHSSTAAMSTAFSQSSGRTATGSRRHAHQ